MTIVYLSTETHTNVLRSSTRRMGRTRIKRCTWPEPKRTEQNKRTSCEKPIQTRSTLKRIMAFPHSEWINTHAHAFESLFRHASNTHSQTDTNKQTQPLAGWLAAAIWLASAWCVKTMPSVAIYCKLLDCKVWIYISELYARLYACQTTTATRSGGANYSSAGMWIVRIFMKRVGSLLPSWQYRIVLLPTVRAMIDTCFFSSIADNSLWLWQYISQHIQL